MNEPRLPTREDIRQLPRWARVAFAARCARRALPVFRERWPAAPAKRWKAVDNAVSVAEHSAAVADATDAARAAASASDEGNAPDAARAARATACTAAYAAAHAVYSDDDTATYAFYAAEWAVRTGIAIERITSDFQTVVELTRKHKWDDTTPVPPSVFGPLEPPSKVHQLEVEFEVPADWTEEQIRAYVAGLADHLDDVHRAAGGHGLKVHDLDILRDAGVPAGVRS